MPDSRRPGTYKRRKRRQRRSFLIPLLNLLLLAALVGGLYLFVRYYIGPKESMQEKTEETTAGLTEETEEEKPQKTGEETKVPSFAADLVETDIYTFLQGPKAWNSKTDWSGEWCQEILAGQYFSVFGCGLCDLANIYSTLTPYDCSPLDMYDFAREVSTYSPSDGYGAIDWPEMRDTLSATGISSELKKKDKTYEEFQKNIAGAATTIALVTSYEDSTYWQDVEGHYVNLWLYDKSDDTVLLGDSGNPDHNRQRIPLRYVYDALKTSDKYQYMVVTDMDEEANTWKHDGIAGKWKKPSYYKS